MTMENTNLFSGENFFASDKWGYLTFVPSHGKKDCLYCLLRYEEEECKRALCCKEKRSDGKNGFFTVRNFPKTM